MNTVAILAQGKYQADAPARLFCSYRANHENNKVVHSSICCLCRGGGLDSEPKLTFFRGSLILFQKRESSYREFL